MFKFVLIFKFVISKENGTLENMVCIRSKNHINVVNLIDKYEARFQTAQASVDWRLEQVCFLFAV